jgi:hypothetical protein
MASCDYSPNNAVHVSPDPDTIRFEALTAGGMDPMFLRFRVVELEQHTGHVLGIQAHNVGFREAVQMTENLLKDGRESHFCLEPVGFLQ